MRLQWFGSGTDIDTIPGFLTGVYVAELRRLGHEVTAYAREQAAGGDVALRTDYVVVQDVDPRQPAFGDWLTTARQRYKADVNPYARCALLTQSDWWVDGAMGVHYADYVTELYRRGAVDVVLSYSREGAADYLKRGVNAAFLCAVAAPSWWRASPLGAAAVDVVYVGSRYNGRESVQDAYLSAMTRAGLSVEAYGERQSGGFVPFSRMAETLARGRLVLALTTPLTAPYYGACTGRVFTGPAAGRATLSNAWAGLEDFFGDAMPAATTPEMAVGQARWLLGDPMRYQIRLGMQRGTVQRAHLYRHRVEALLGYLTYGGGE